jgi:hypothetical protein
LEEPSLDKAKLLSLLQLLLVTFFSLSSPVLGEKQKFVLHYEGTYYLLGPFGARQPSVFSL